MQEEILFIIWYTDEDAKNLAKLAERKFKYPQAIGAIDMTRNYTYQSTT